MIDYQVTKDPKLEPFKVEGILPVEEKEGREEALLAAIQDDFILNNKLDLVSLGGKIEQLVRSISGEELANKPLGSEDPEEAAREERLLREVDWLVKRLTSYYLITRPDADRNEVREGILRELYDLSRRVHPEKLVDRPQKTPTLSLPPLSVEPPVYTPKKVEEEVESETEKQEQEQQEQQGEQEQSKEPEATKQEPSSVEVATEEGSEQTEVEQVEVETEVATSETETETVEVATEVEPTETDGQTSTITEEVVEVEVEQQEQEQVEGTEASTSEGQRVRSSRS